MSTCLAPWRCPHASRAPATFACLSRPGDARMPQAPAMPACLTPGDARVPHARRCPHASRPGDARMPHAPAMPACLTPGDDRRHALLKVPHCTMLRPSFGDHVYPRRQATRYTTGDRRSGAIKATGDHVPEKSEIAYSFNYGDLVDF
ncbi:hypothetical protein VNO80_10225 [Phaseolus coccineus]|uniref:Uncharacterized protein n=1 Tax=Phaseolus coccineus TaxID=3886 RepID=A0AAN9LFV2_PHACN